MSTLYIFDLDDTLMDSRVRFENGLFSVLEEDGIPYDAASMIELTTPLGLSGSAQYFHDVLGVRGTTQEILRRIEQSMERLYAEVIGPRPGVIPFLQTLSAQGARCFVLTATPHSLTDVCLARNGMLPFFEAVWSTDDFGFSKSDPRLFPAVANRLGVPGEEILYFEDSITALKNAKLAGFRTYAVFNAHTEEQIRYLRANFEGFVESFENVPPITADRP